MAYNSFIKISQEIIDQLPFLGEGYQYLFSDSQAKTYRGILYQMKDTEYKKACEKLLGKQEGEILPGDKVFVMSGCSIPQFKIKDYLKGKGATMTGDITECTKFIGNKMSSCHVSYMGDTKSSNLLMNVNHPGMAQGEVSSIVTVECPNIIETESSLSVNLQDVRYNHLVSDEGLVGGLNNHSGKRQFITPLGAMIIYQSILRDIVIINDDHIFKDLEKVIALDEDSYQSLKSMLESKDADNHKVSADILANCDIEKSMFWLWKLARKHSYDVGKYSQWKNIRLFMEKSNWYSLSGMNSEGFIKFMHTRGLLTAENFDVLIKDAAELYRGSLSTNLFNMVLTPVSKYRDYVQPDHVFPVGLSKQEPVPVICNDGYDDNDDDL